jgi:putative ABC transport system substrate-binding protein
VAAKHAASEIPVVIALAADAVALGLVKSLARPRGNVTDVSASTADTGGKTLEILREILPTARRVVALGDRDTTFGRHFLERMAQAGKLLGLRVEDLSIKGTGRMTGALPTLTSMRPDAVILQRTLGVSSADLILK